MRYKFTLLSAILAFSCFVATAQIQDTIRILAVGNEWSADVCTRDTYGYFEAGGQPVVIGYVCKDDCDYAELAALAKSGAPAFRYGKVVRGETAEREGVSLAQALKDERWDVVSLQTQSAQACRRETIDPGLGQLIKYVRKRTPKSTRLMYFQTWPYAHQSTMHWMAFGHNNVDMYRLLAAVSREFTEKYGLEVIPIGTTVENLRSSFSMQGDVTFADRLNRTMGSYAAAATFYEAVTGRDARELTDAYAPYTLENHVRREMAAKCAHFACLKPFEMTDMKTGTGSYGSEEAGLPNYDETKVPAYTLPDPLVMNDGTPVTSIAQWEGERRAELLELFRREVYGRSPDRLEGQHYKVVLTDENAIGGMATRQEILIYFDASEEKYIRLVTWVPNGLDHPAPAFLMMNTSGNASINEDQTISYPDEQQLKNYVIHGFPAYGQYRHFYPLELILARGYAFLSFYKSDLDPDFDDGFENGVHPYIYKKGQTFPEPDQWAGLSAYAWGCSRVMDWLEEAQTSVDPHRVSTIGHSRGGKTALWAAAQDTRFAMAISNDSGCGGAAISRRRYGQTVRQIQTTFPQWFCRNFLKYMDNEDALPVDQHELVALIAPRPVYVGSAAGDMWADPKGEFLSLVHAKPVYELYGIHGLPTDVWPDARQPLFGDHMGYHLRLGRHAIFGYDWVQYLEFADKYL